MATFDAEKYFANRAAELEQNPSALVPNVGDPLLEKMQAVADASRTKQIDFLQRFAKQREAEIAMDRNSLVSQLGLNPDSLAGRSVNVLANVGTGIGTVVSQVASAPFALSAMIDSRGLPENARQAYIRAKAGQATPEDIALLNTTPDEDVRTYGQRAMAIDEASTRAEAGRDYWTQSSPLSEDLVHRAATRRLQQDLAGTGDAVQASLVSGWNKLKAGNEDFSGMADIVGGIAKGLAGLGGAVLTHPQAALEQIMQQTPQLAAGAVFSTPGVAATAGTYALTEFGKGVSAYQDKHGELPPQPVMEKMAIHAAGLMAAEFLGDKIVLGAGKLGKTLSGAADEVGAATRAGFKNSLLGHTAVAGAEGATGEFATEGYQTWGENEIQGKDTSISDIYQGGAMGAIAGGGMSTGMHALAEVTNTTPEKIEQRQEDAQTKLATAAKIAEAAASGDVSGFLDPQHADYNPEHAARALYLQNQNPATSEETKAANLKQVETIHADLQKQQAKAEALYDEVSPKTYEEMKQNLKQAKKDGATADVEMLQGLLDEIKAGKNKARARKDALDTVSSQLENTGKLLDSLSSATVAEATVSPEELSQVAADATTSPVGKRMAAKKVLAMAMTSADMVDPVIADTLAKDTNNGLTSVERTYLQRFSETKQAEHALKKLVGVTQDIVKGSPTYAGLQQYREQIGAALQAGNTARVTERLGTLQKFIDTRAPKMAALQQALSEYHGQPLHVFKDASGTWSVASGLMAEAERKANGAYNFQPNVNHAKNIQQFALEQTLAESTLAELKASATMNGVQLPKEEKGTAKTAVNSVDNTRPAGAVVEKGTQEKEAQPEKTAEVSSKQQEQKKEELTNSVDTVEGQLHSKEKKSIDSSSESKPAPAEVDLPWDALPGMAETKAEIADLAPEEIARLIGLIEADLRITHEKTDPASDAESTQASQNDDAQAAAGVSGVSEKSVAKVTGDAAAAVAVPDGTLPALRQSPAPEGTLIKALAREGKMAVTYLKQVLQREGDVTSRPLVAVQDFLSKWLGKEVSMFDFISLPREQLSTEQAKLVKVFQLNAEQWGQTIRNSLSLWNTKDKSYLYRDPLQEFMFVNADGKVDLPENMKTAMSYAALSWMIETINKPLTNDTEQIAAILSKEESELTDEEIKAHRHTVARENTVANALGQRVVQALGLTAKADAPMNYLPMLEVSLGVHALQLMETLGWIAVDRTAQADRSMSGFVSLVREKKDNNRLIKDLLQLKEVARGNKGILDQLFSVESAMLDPSLTPVKFAQQHTKGGQEITKEQAAILERDNAQKNFVKQQAWAVFEALDDDILLSIAGGASPKQAALQAAAEAKNQALEREIRLFKDFVEFTLAKGEDWINTPFYFSHEVWDQYRVGIANNTINPQMSKVHRHLIAREGWKTTVDLQSLDHFKLRVLEGMGIKTGDEPNATTLQRRPSLFDPKATPTDPKVETSLNAAIDVLVSRLQGNTLTREQQEIVRDGVKAGGEKMHSFDALVALAELRFAQITGKTSFETELVGEIDGVSNGPIMAHAMLGAADTAEDLAAVLQKGGIFTAADGEQNYNFWHHGANLDLYESMTKAAFGWLAAQKKESKIPFVYEAVQHFIGDLMREDGTVTKDGRNLSKDPIRPLVFGSGKGRAVESMAEAYVENIYKKLEKLEDTAEARQAAIKALNTLLYQVPKVSLQATREDLLALEFTPAQAAAIKKQFMQTFGKAYKATIETELGPFLQRRDEITRASKLIYTLYHSAYTALREEYVAKLIADKQVEIDQHGKPAHDLSVKQEAAFQEQIADLIPMMHTAYSATEGNLKAGLPVFKEEKQLSQDRLYQPEVHLHRPGTSQKTTQPHAQQRVLTGPGVRLTSMPIHAADSAVSHRANPDGSSLNVHDAQARGLNGFTEMGHALNQALWNTLVDTSPLRELSESMQRTVQGIAQLLQRKEIPANLREYLVQGLAEFTAKSEDLNPGNVLSVVVASLQETAHTADQIKLEFLGQTTFVDQYSSEGASYEVTEANRQVVADKLAALPAQRKLQPKTKTGIDLITNMVAPKVEQAPLPDVSAKATVTAETIRDLLKAKGTMPAKEVLRLVYRALPNDASPMKAFYYELLKELGSKVSDELTISWANDEQQAVMQGKAVAQFEKGGHISVNREIQANRLIQAVLHETVHAVLVPIVDNPTGAGEDLVAELMALRGIARAYVAENNLTGYNWLFEEESIHELIAHGMTSQRFQDQVLKQIRINSRNWKNQLVTGMKAFIGAIVKAVFPNAAKNRQEIAQTGLAVLFTNVAGLMAQQAQATEAKTNTVLSMAIGNPMSYTTTEILDGLTGGHSPEFTSHLRGLLTSIVKAIYSDAGTLGDKVVFQNAPDIATAWMDAKTQNEAPFAAKLMNAGVALSDQEAFTAEQVEATVRTVIADPHVQVMAARRELHRLYQEARQTLTVMDLHAGDWTTATPAEQQKAQTLYDFLFKVEKVNGDETDHLSRFAALGMSSEAVRTALSRGTSTQLRSVPQNFAEKIQRWFERALEWFTHRLTGTTLGQPQHEALEQLTHLLVRSEISRRQKLLSKQTGVGLNPIGRLEKAGAWATAQVRAGVAAAAQSKLVQNYTTGIGKLAGTGVAILAKGQMAAVMGEIQKLIDRHQKDHSSLVTALMGDVLTPQQKFEALQRQAKRNEAQRESLATNVATVIEQAFTQPISKQEHGSATAVFLRTGAHVLLDTFSLDELAELLVDPRKLQRAIDAEVAQLTAFGADQHWYKQQSQLLGYYLATGKVVHPATLMNALSISLFHGSAKSLKQATKQSEKALPIIDRLASLYALQSSESVDKTQARAVLQRDGNAIETAMRLQAAFEQHSRETLFAGKEVLMSKGYLPEIHDPHRDVQTANQADGEVLINKGYVQVARVARDPADPDQSVQHLYVLHGGGLSRRTTGSIAYASENTRGSRLHNGMLHGNLPLTSANQTAQAQLDAQRARMTQELFAPLPNFAPHKINRKYMAPVINGDGQVVNYRYIMEQATRDSVLRRDNRMHILLGQFAGSVHDKISTPQQNSDVLEALQDVFKTDFGKDPDKFVKIGPNSKNAELREIYRLLPESTKEKMKALGGKEGMYVPKSLVYPVFGYRKHSLADIFDKNPVARSHMEKVFAIFVEDVLLGSLARIKGIDPEKFKQRAGVYVKRTERAVKELMDEIKDMIVIRSWTVLRDNIKSNFSLLFLYGVPFETWGSHFLVALRAGRDYQKSRDALLQAQHRLLVSTDATQQKQLRDEIALLENELTRNPVKDLIEGGLMPTIVEDVELHDDPYSYRSWFTDTVEEYTKHVPEGLKTAGKWVMMSPSTPVHQALRRLTSLSDFAARYTLYMHLTQTKQVSKEDALFQSSEAFVNYDRALHPTMQWLDDHGFMLFMKYFMRIQRIIALQVKERPLRVLTLALLQELMGNLAPVTDSSALAHFGNNPMASSVLGIFGAKERVLTLQMGMSLVK